MALVPAPPLLCCRCQTRVDGAYHQLLPGAPNACSHHPRPDRRTCPGPAAVAVRPRPSVKSSALLAVCSAFMVYRLIAALPTALCYVDPAVCACLLAEYMEGELRKAFPEVKNASRFSLWRYAVENDSTTHNAFLCIKKALPNM